MKIDVGAFGGIGWHGVAVARARRATGKLGWLALSLLWSTLLLVAFGALFGLTTLAGPATPALAAAPAQDEPAVGFSREGYTVNEATMSDSIVLLVDPPSSSPITLTVSSANIQAEASLDFEGLRQSLVISASAAAYTLELAILDDAIVEGNEQLRLTLSNYHGVQPGAITETIITIEDNDIAYLGVSDVTVDEDAGSALVVITQSVLSSLQSVVSVRTQEGSALASQDFQTLVTNAVIAPGSTAATVTIPLQDDMAMEPTETFAVLLQDPTNAQFANQQAALTSTVTIVDDDIYPQLQGNTAEALEADGMLPFVISLSSTWGQTVTVEYATVDDEAIAPQDYLSSTGVLTFAPGVVTATVTVPLVIDEVKEPDEHLFLLLTNPVQAILSNDEIEGIIHDLFDPTDPDTHHTFLPGLGSE